MIYDSEKRLWLPGRLSGTPRSQRGAIGVMAQRMPLKPFSQGPPADFGSPAYSWWADLGLFSDDAHTTPQTTNGGVVANWRSRIDGTTYLAQTNNGRRPTLNTTGQNGHYGLTFVASDDGIGANFSLSTPFTEFIVFRTDKPSQTGRIAIGPSNTFTTGRVSDNTLEMDVTGAGPQVPAANWSASTTLILCCVYNGSGGGDTGTRIRVNANSAITTPNIVPTTGSVGGRWLGSQADGTNGITGTIMAYVLYASALGTSDETSERNVLNGWYAAF